MVGSDSEGVYLGVSSRKLENEMFRKYSGDFLKVLRWIYLNAQYAQSISYRSKYWDSELKRGEVALSVRELAKTSGIEHSALRRILKKMEKVGEIKMSICKLGTKITAIHYDRNDNAVKMALKKVTHPISSTSDSNKTTYELVKNKSDIRRHTYFEKSDTPIKKINNDISRLDSMGLMVGRTVDNSQSYSPIWEKVTHNKDKEKKNLRPKDKKTSSIRTPDSYKLIGGDFEVNSQDFLKNILDIIVCKLTITNKHSINSIRKTLKKYESYINESTIYIALEDVSCIGEKVKVKNRIALFHNQLKHYLSVLMENGGSGDV